MRNCYRDPVTYLAPECHINYVSLVLEHLNDLINQSVNQSDAGKLGIVGIGSIGPTRVLVGLETSQ